MISNFFSSIKNTFSIAYKNRIERSNVITSLDNLTRAISGEFMSSLELLNASPEIVKKLDMGVLPRMLGGKSNMDTLKMMYSFFKDVSNTFAVLKKDIYAALPPITTSKVVSVKAMVYIKIIDDLTSMASWYSGYTMSILINKKESNIPDMYFNTINATVVNFVNLYKIYNGKLNVILEDARKMENVNVDINDDNSSAVTSTILDGSNRGLLVLSDAGFTGNPIFTTRIWFVELTVLAVEKLEYQNKVRQLAINKLRAELEGELDPTTRDNYQKQIARYEEMITKSIVLINRLKST